MTNQYNLTQKIKIKLSFFRCLPFHPQWILFLHEKKSNNILQEVKGTVLDIGCGNGKLRDLIKRDCLYIGLDFPTTIQLGYRGKVDVFGDGQSLPFKNESFDTIVLMDVLEHLSRPDSAIKEAFRTLKNGKLIFQVPFLYPLHDEPYDFQRWTVHGLKNLIEKEGFKIENISFYGNPIETATVLFCIAITKIVIDSIQNKPAALLLAPLILVIPFINIFGWLFGNLTPKSSFMPLGYQVIATKNT